MSISEHIPNKSACDSICHIATTGGNEVSPSAVAHPSSVVAEPHLSPWRDRKAQRVVLICSLRYTSAQQHKQSKPMRAIRSATQDMSTQLLAQHKYLVFYKATGIELPLVGLHGRHHLWIKPSHHSGGGWDQRSCSFGVRGDSTLRE